MFRNNDTEIYLLKNVARIVIAGFIYDGKKIMGVHNLTGRAPRSVQKFLVCLEQHVRFVVLKNADHKLLPTVRFKCISR